MRRPLARCKVFVLLALGLPSVAVAQQMNSHRGYVAVNGGTQVLSGEFTDAATFAGPSPVYTKVVSGAATGEASSFNGAYRVESGPVVDVSGGARVWRNLGVGVSVSLYRKAADASVSARLPHPFFLGSAPRTIAGSMPLYHEERAVHLHALVAVPINPAFTVTVFGGPTVFTLWHDLVTDVRFTHSYPYDDAAFAGIVTREQSRSTVGFNAGVDVAYYFTDTVGVGWLTRFSAGTIDLPSAGDQSVEVPGGGFHAAGGLRLRF